MTVCVDSARLKYRHMLMCHMMADTHLELIEMAKSIGVQAKWFHRDHFNICQSKRALAVRNGAVEVTSRDLVRFRKKGKLS